MPNTPITIEMIYELLKEFKADTHRRFTEADERRREDKAALKEQIDRVHEDLQEVKHAVQGEQKRLDQVYEARHDVKIKFGWQLGMASMFIALFSAMIATYIH